MLRAMDSAVSGLRAHQNKLDVIGHNIANVNTAGYKAQSYLFKEAMYQTSTASTSGSGNAFGAGGVNAAQYGYGAMMGSIWVDMTNSTPTQMGGLTATIDGEGFFMTMSTSADSINVKGTVTEKSDAIKGSNFQYTRVGQFKIDSQGFLVDCNSNNYIYGYRTKGNCLTSNAFDTEQLQPIRVCNAQTLDKTTGNPNKDLDAADEFNISTTSDDIALASSVKIDSEGKITIGIKVKEEVTDAQGNVSYAEVTKEAVIGRVAIAKFQNQEGLTKSGGGYYTASRGDNSGFCIPAAPGEGGEASLLTGYVESSNVDMAKEFVDLITTQRGFQANSKIITVSDQILEELVNLKR